MSPPTIGLITVTDLPIGTRIGEWDVELDGVLQTCVTAASDTEGWCEHYVTDNDGLVVIAGDVAVTEQLRGHVRLIYTGRDPRYAAFRKSTP